MVPGAGVEPARGYPRGILSPSFFVTPRSLLDVLFGFGIVCEGQHRRFVPIGQVTADGSGNWSFTPSTPLADGTVVNATTSPRCGSTASPRA